MCQSVRSEQLYPSGFGVVEPTTRQPLAHEFDAQVKAMEVNNNELIDLFRGKVITNFGDVSSLLECVFFIIFIYAPTPNR